MAEGDVQVGAILDPSSEARLSALIEEALVKGFDKGVDKLAKLLGSNAKISAAFKKMGENAFDPKAFKKLTDGLTAGQKQTAQLIDSYKQLGAAVSTINKQIEQDTTNQSKVAIRERERELADLRRSKSQEQQVAAQAVIAAQGDQARLTAAIKEEVKQRTQAERAALDAEGRAQRQSYDLEITQAKTAGKMRVDFTRAAIAQIMALEKTLATGIGELLHGTLSVAGKVATGVKDVFAKGFSGIASVFHKSDAEMNAGLEGSLSKREAGLRSSFERQTQIVSSNTLKQTEIVRAGAARQAAAVEELRAATSVGVAGSVKSVALGAGLLGGGVAIFQALKSTFTVGSEFIRGLAVVQAQLSLTAEDMKNVRQLSIDLGNDLSLPGVSALDAAQAIATLTKTFAALGPRAVVAAQLAAKGTLQLARAAGVSADEAGALIGSAVNVFGVAADKAVSVADEITGALTHAAGVSFQNFADAFTQGASVFSSFITPAEGATASLVDFNAALAILAKNGIVGGTAGAGLKSFFLLGRRESGKAGAAMEELVKRAGAAGTLFFDASGKARTFAESVDILRKGVAGLTDAQRVNDLTTLFGSRGVTAANALIKTSAADYEVLRQQILQEGLAAKIAAAQNTGFKGALDALQSVAETVQILFYEKVNPALAKATLFIADLANEVFFGNGAWATFRQVMIGAAAGIGAIIAVKGAIEVIQLLGLAAKAALSPFTLLLLAAAGIGAAIQLGIGPIKSFGQIIDFVKDRAADLGVLFKTYVMPLLISFGDWVTSSAIPTIKRWASILERDLVGAFHATVNFITGTVVPALKAFGGYIADKVVPIAISFGETVQRWFGVGLQAVKDFWHFIQPFLSPAAAGFKALGSAIGDIFSKGDFHGLLGGLGSAASGVGKVAAGLGSTILDALKPIGTKIVDWLSGIFTMKNLGKIGGGLLDFVEFVGRFLGSHVDFAVEWAAKIGLALAGAAVAVGGRFLIGFIDGLTQSLPRLLGDFVDKVLELLKGAFSGDIISIVLLGGGALAAFKLFGTQAATSLVGGFKSAAGGGIGFLQGFFGGADSAQAKTAFKSFRDEINMTQNKLRILGSTTIVEPRNIDAAKGELRRLEGGFTSAQVAGLTMRDKVNGAVTAIGGTLKGIAGVGKGIAIGITQGFGQGAAQIRTSFQSTVNGLRTVAQEQGTTLGKYIGKGVAVGLAAAAGGFIAGRAAGAQGVNPILAGLTTGLTTSAIAGPIVGTVAGVAGTIGAAFGQADKAAADLKARIDHLADTIKGKLKQSLEDGTLATLDFQTALSGGSGKDVGEAIVASLSSGVKAALVSAGIDASDIVDAIKVGDLSGLKNQIKDALNPQGIEPGNDAFNDISDRTLAAYKALDVAAQGYGQAVRDLANDNALLNRTQSDTIGYWVAAMGPAGALTAALAGVAEAATMVDPKLKAIAAAASGATGPIDALDAGASRVFDHLGGLSTLPPPKLDVATLTAAIDEIDAKVGELNSELDQYMIKIALAFGAAGATEQATNQGVLDIQNAVTALGAIDPTSGLEVDKANSATAINQITTDISNVVTAGLTDGTVKGVEDAKAAVTPLLVGAMQAIDKLDIPESAKAALRVQVAALFNDGFANATPDIIAAADAATAVAQEGIRRGMLAAVLRAKTDGINVVDGLTAGLSDSAAGARLTAQAQALGAIITNATKTYLQIKSPSKVMYDIGVFAGQGLAEGLAASTDNLGNIITNAVEDAVGKATTAAQAAQKSLQATFGGLFDFSLTPAGGAGGGVFGVGANVASGITLAIQTLLSSFDSTVASAMSVGNAAGAAAAGTGPALTAAQLDILGESIFSLNPSDVLGSQNLASLTAALTAVQDAGKALLANGADPSDVASVLSEYTKEIKDQAVGLGLSSDGIDALISQLGLSDTALADFVGSTKVAASAMADATAALAAAASVAAKAHLEDNLFELGDINPYEYMKILEERLKAEKYGTDEYVAIYKQLKALRKSIDDSIPAYDPTAGKTAGSDHSPYLFVNGKMVLVNGQPILKNSPEAAAYLANLANPHPGTTPTPSTPDPVNDHLPTAGTVVFNVYPPTVDPAAFALGAMNKLATLVYTG